MMLVAGLCFVPALGWGGAWVVVVGDWVDCPDRMMGEKYISMVVWGLRRRDLLGRAGWTSGGMESCEDGKGSVGVLMVGGSWSCQISQCNALQSCSERRAWVGGAGRSVGSVGVVWSWQTCGEVGSEARGGQSGVAWTYPHRQHTQKGRLAMRLRDGRVCGMWLIPMVRLVSGMGVVGPDVGSGSGCSCGWSRLRRRPNVRFARSGRAGLRRRSFWRMIWSWFLVRAGSIY